jgi:hypothetical protein
MAQESFTVCRVAFWVRNGGGGSGCCRPGRGSGEVADPESHVSATCLAAVTIDDSHRRAYTEVIG